MGLKPRKEIYSVKFAFGKRQELVKAFSATRAKEFARGQWGDFSGPYAVAKATKADIAWAKEFGGDIHTA